jgi:hypothetical protein
LSRLKTVCDCRAIDFKWLEPVSDSVAIDFKGPEPASGFVETGLRSLEAGCK